MVSVIIPTEGVERPAVATLAALVPGAASGLVREVLLVERVSISGRPRAGIFRYARSPYSDTRLRDGFKFVARMIAGPSADQGLLIARDHYERLGGHAPDARRSEARLLRQLGRSSRTLLRSRIVVA